MLKKWASNSSLVLDRNPSKDRAQHPSFDPEDMPSMKVLRLHWVLCADVFGYHTNSQDIKIKDTWRSVNHHAIVRPHWSIGTYAFME